MAKFTHLDLQRTERDLAVSLRPALKNLGTLLDGYDLSTHPLPEAVLHDIHQSVAKARTFLSGAYGHDAYPLELRRNSAVAYLESAVNRSACAQLGLEAYPQVNAAILRLEPMLQQQIKLLQTLGQDAGRSR